MHCRCQSYRSLRWFTRSNTCFQSFHYFQLVWVMRNSCSSRPLRLLSVYPHRFSCTKRTSSMYANEVILLLVIKLGYLFRLPDDIWLIDLDSNKLTPPTGFNEEIPTLPEPEGTILKNHLKQVTTSSYQLKLFHFFGKKFFPQFLTRTSNGVGFLPIYQCFVKKYGWLCSWTPKLAIARCSIGVKLIPRLMIFKFSS